MEQIIAYLKGKYAPRAIIVYGSYADGSNNEHSDFDALLISEVDGELHDVSFVGGVQLDVFVYPPSRFEGGFDCGEFARIFDGNVILDTEGRGAALKKAVLDYIGSRPRKTEDELRAQIDWCRKMWQRTRRNDSEGMFRWHWLLTDSLEIFCDTAGQAYLGPKKSLRWMEMRYPEAFALYKNALFNFEPAALAGWVGFLETLAGQRD